MILRSDNCAEINEASNTASKPSISAPTSHKTSKQEMSVRLLHRILQTGFSVLQGFWSTQKTKFPARQSQKLKTICFLNAIKSNLRLHHIVYPGVSRKTLLEQVEQTTASNSLIWIQNHKWVCEIQGLFEFTCIAFVDKTQPRC